MKNTAENQFDIRFHPWPGWPDNTPWCTRCTFRPADDYERLAEKLVEAMHMYAMHTHTEPHQVAEGYNNLVRIAAFELRATGRKGIRSALARFSKAPEEPTG